MNNSRATEITRAILIDLGIPEESLHNDTRLYEDLQLDSTEIVELVLSLKQQLGISVKLEGRQEITLAQLSNKVEEAMLTQSTSDPVT